MRAYIIRRLLLIIPTLFLATLITFFIIRLVPGDIIDAMIEQLGYGTNLEATKAAVEHKLGLDAPIIVQYGRWVGNIILHGDLGNSLWKDSPVIRDIAARWPVTLELGLLGLIVAQLIALPIGIYSALRQDTWGDYIARSFSILCIAIPGFWLGTMIVVFPSIWWGYSPSLVLISFTEDPIGNLGQFIIPAIVLGMALSGITMRMSRTMMLEVLRQDYIRTAWAKGLRERVVVIRHALKNALIPVITIVGLQMGILVGGTVIIEQIFCLPGMGSLIVEATNKRDYTIVSGVMLIFAILMLFINLIVDLTYSFLDPRVHYK
jgi:peptide/nickel transport system permease protein